MCCLWIRHWWEKMCVIIIRICEFFWFICLFLIGLTWMMLCASCVRSVPSMNHQFASGTVCIPATCKHNNATLIHNHNLFNDKENFCCSPVTRRRYRWALGKFENPAPGAGNTGNGGLTSVDPIQHTIGLSLLTNEQVVGVICQYCISRWAPGHNNNCTQIPMVSLCLNLHGLPMPSVSSTVRKRMSCASCGAKRDTRRYSDIDERTEILRHLIANAAVISAMNDDHTNSFEITLSIEQCVLSI